MTKRLITKSAALLEDRGFTQITSAQDRQRKSGGITHTVFTHDDSGEKFLVRAKEYVYHDKAPFGKGMVGHAVDTNAMLIIYFDDQERFLVFDPEYVAEAGITTEGRSKRSDEPRVYLEVPIDDGARLSAYIAGRERPTLPGAKRQGPNSGLDEFI